MTAAKAAFVPMRTAVLASIAMGGALAQGQFAFADPAVSVRSGDHAGFGRIVVDTTSEPQYSVEQSGDRVVVRLLQPLVLDRAPAKPHNVASLRTAGSTLELTLQPGATMQASVMDGHLVLDVNDPKPVAAPSAAAAPAANKSRRGRVTTLTAMMGSPELGGRSTAPPSPSGAPTTSTPAAEARRVTDQKPPAAAGPLQPQPPDQQAVAAIPVVQAAVAGGPPRGPVDLLARSARLPAGAEGSAFILPLAATTGAAAFRHNQDVWVVFDERRPLDLSSLRADPVFGRAEVRLLAAGTLLRLPLDTDTAVTLAPSQTGWRIAGTKAAIGTQPITAVSSNNEISLPAELPANVIAMADPDTGATLLVGTTRRPGQGVALTRRSAEFILRPTTLGVVVEPLSDALTLKVGAAGFILGQQPNGLAISPSAAGTGASGDALSLTRRLPLTAAAPEQLLPRLIKQIDDAAMAPPQARGPKRLAAAQTMLLLGMAAEAQSLMRVVAEGDPKLAASPEVAALASVAALLAGRTAEADGLDGPRLNGWDGIALWRAVRQAMQEDGSPAAAAVFAATAPLVSLYPKAVRDRILPLIAETLIQAGEISAGASLLEANKDDPRLAFAAALLAQKRGDDEKALSMLDRIALGRDQFDRARAAVQAVEIRLAANKMAPAQAADAMDRLVYAWRGDQRELALRERIADLREKTGEWRIALATLRQAEADFPDSARQVHIRLQAAFADMIADPRLQTLPPIDVVATIEENADLAAARPGDSRVQEQLADRLLALDLPNRAGPVLDRLMQSAATPLSKALYGANLAALAAREKNDAAALAALNASEAPDLPAALAERRTVLRAETLAHAGDPQGADALLTALGTPAALGARAVMLEQVQDWQGAERAWADYAAKSLPESGTLDADQARILVRLATAAARAGDDAELRGLRDKYGDRLPDGALVDMFRLLTAEPVRNTSDLQRVRQDISLAQSLPANLRAVYGATPPPKN